MIPVFRAKVEKNILSIFDKDNFRIWLSKFENQEVDLTVKKPNNSRTTKQNSFYWKYLTLIEEETGNNTMDLHEVAKRKFLKPIFKTVMGKEYKLPASTTKLSKTEFSEYMDKICAWSGVPIPEIK